MKIWEAADTKEKVAEIVPSFVSKAELRIRDNKLAISTALCMHNVNVV